MKAFLLFQQMLVLAAMMMCGFLAFKLKWIDRPGAQKLSTLVVRIFNPIMILSSVLGKRSSDAAQFLKQDLLLAGLYFAFVILFGLLYAKLRRFDRPDANKYQFLLAFSNLGFMGIPVVRSVFGPEYVIYIVIYLLIFNVLVYTYGVWLAMGMGNEKKAFSPRILLNTGVIICVAAVILFAFQIQVPEPVETFCSYMGDTAIPLSMMAIGISLAQSDLKQLFLDMENYIFILVKMLVMPAAGVLLFRLLPVDLNETVFAIFTLMVSMPCGAIGGMFAQEYAGRGDECNRLILLTTVVSVVTVPLISLI